MIYNNLKITPEDKLLLLCSRTELDDEIISEISLIIEQGINWNYLLKRSFEHKLTPILYWRLNTIFSNSIPVKIKEYLQVFFKKNALKNLLFMSELKKLLECFNINNINSLPYKGPLLALLAYGSIALRQFNDIDIFICKKDIVKVKNLLSLFDYKPEIELDSIEVYIHSQRELHFFNNMKNIHLELHWNFEGLFFYIPHGNRILNYNNSFSFN